MVEVFPIYGWGWMKGTVTLKVPTAFMVELSEIIGTGIFFEKAIGVVASPPSHELFGYRVVLIKRTESVEGCDYDLVMRNDDTLELAALNASSNTVIGYGKIVSLGQRDS